MADLRFAAAGPDKQRVSVMEDAAEYSLVHNGPDLWAYDSGSNTAWHAKAPKDAKGAHGKSAERWQGKKPGAVTPQEIAISIVAELIAVKHGKAQSPSLRWTPPQLSTLKSQV